MRQIICSIMLIAVFPLVASGLDGGPLQVTPRNGWRAFEVITLGDNPVDDYDWSMPGQFDGVGIWQPDADTLRFFVNHELSDGTISEVDVDLAAFHSVLGQVMLDGTTGGTSFVKSARQSYDRWTNDGGLTWIETSDVSNTSFSRFCSGQSYEPHTFGENRGFVDTIYMTGEERSGGRLFVVDAVERDFYQLSGVTGDSGAGGLAGMPFDAYENAALLDTGETDHVAIVLAPDGGTQRMQLYIGEKGKGLDGSPDDGFLARNGLAYGSHYYFNATLPRSRGETVDGTFDTTLADVLRSSKLEDVDTSPSAPHRFVLGDQDSGEYVFDMSLDFSSGGFAADTSTFSLTKIQDLRAGDGFFGSPDNVDWTRPTTLGGVHYPDGIIFTNEDTSTGEIWMSDPSGDQLVKIGDTTDVIESTESTGVLDISEWLGYVPGSIVATSNQGSAASLTILVNPDARVVPEPTTTATCTLLTLIPLVLRRRRLSSL